MRKLLVFIVPILLMGCTGSLWVNRPNSKVSLRGATAKDSIYVENNSIYMGMRRRFVRAALGPPEEVDHAYAKGPNSGQTWLYRLPMRCVEPGRCPDYAVSKVYISNGKVSGFADIPGKYTGL
jgi:hypothetical protein